MGLRRHRISIASAMDLQLERLLERASGPDWRTLAAATMILVAAGCAPKVLTETEACPFSPCDNFAFTSAQSATVVLGQPDFLTNTTTTTSAATLSGNEGSAYFDGTWLYVPDQGENRVLGFQGIPATSGAAASFVIGQADTFTTANSGTSATQFQGPSTVVESGGKFFVADLSNIRALLWNTPPTGSVAADIAVGQPDLVTRTPTCTASGLNAPRSVAVTGSTLLVADGNNAATIPANQGHRILIWNQIPTAGATNADLVLGQTSFTSCAVNGGGSASASTLNTPTSIWTDGRRLAVADWQNNRVLIWSTFPTANGQAADIVLGQGTGAAAFTTTSPAAGQGGLNGPTVVESNGLQFFVADAGNNRVLMWNTFPTQSGAQPDVVLGQIDFTQTTANQGGGPAGGTLDSPFGLKLFAPNGL